MSSGIWQNTSRRRAVAADSDIRSGPELKWLSQGNCCLMSVTDCCKEPWDGRNQRDGAQGRLDRIPVACPLVSHGALLR